MEWLDLLNEIFQVCVIPLLGVLTTFAVKFINKKTAEVVAKSDSDLLDKYIKMLGDTVANCVIATNQTYVKSLKDKDGFDLEAQKEAFELTKDSVLRILSDDAKNCLTNAYGDLGILVDQLIEAEVGKNK